jgi:hypothetical protein
VPGEHHGGEEIHPLRTQHDGVRGGSYGEQHTNSLGFQDPESKGGPITPLHLQLGHAWVDVRQVRFDETPRLTKRLQFVEETKKQFMINWMQQVFRGRVLSHKWTKTVRVVVLLGGREQRPNL